jgi:predicted pyridoxine 5'-phosphate oxidase superfamily flavin-nucleotide-binding protein
MTGRYAQIAFSPAVRAHQRVHGSVAAYDRMAANGGARPDSLGEDEKAFIEQMESALIASVGEAGWPYVQHRGGPAGFLHVLGERTIGFADFRGNRQYITRGNLDHNPRVALFLLDHVLQARMKIFGNARVVEPEEDPELLAWLAPEDYPAKVERAVLIDVEAFDWNCRQHIPRMYPAESVESTVAELQGRIAMLEAQLESTGTSPKGPGHLADS